VQDNDHVNNIINKEQIEFMKERRTTDHMFVLKTLLDKYGERNSKALYACFVDFKSAFDTVWHQGLLYKFTAYMRQCICVLFIVTGSQETSE
jgi:hypothetical protein